jgi:HD-like signal output (HDOD) protein
LGREAGGKSFVPNQIREQLKECKTLPTLPGVAVELLAQFQNREVDLQEIAGIIRKDPALAAKVLGFVNSPFCGVRKEVTSIHHAVALLGLSSVQTIALSFSLIRGLRKTDLGGFDFHRFWCRSILAAAAARALGASRKGLEREQLFLSGLLQDIGMLALQSLLPKEYGELNRLAGKDHTKLHELEKDRLGIDHAEAGRYLAEYWHLPSIYQLAIQSSHDPEQVETDEEHQFMLEYVALSGWLAEVWLDRSESLVYLRGRAGD